jgi:glycosyltransferase involved in cell wall biosynthesis
MIQHKASVESDADRRPVDSRGYVVILPVRDEEKFVRLTLESMACQTVLPRELLVVDDGSRDGTVAIVTEFTTAYPWIRLVQRPDRGKRALGAGVVESFKFGQENLSVSDFEFIVKLDGDLSFEADYFERLFIEFARNPKIGIASGQTYIVRDGALVLERINKGHTRGPCKVYRRSCFDQIGGLVSTIGWDMVDDLYAQYHGWETQSYPELVLTHHRPMGTSQGSIWQGKVRHGRGRYVTGSHPLFVLASGIYRMADRPFVICGVGIIYGYFSAWIGGHPQIDNPDIKRFRRRKELEMLSPLNAWRKLRGG